MTRILHIDTSPRDERSHSRRLASKFIDSWKAAHPEDVVIYRDIGHEPLPYVDENWVAGAFTPPEKHTPEMTKAIALSESLIDELKTCDCYVFSIPMYNFSVPAVFKSYIDQILRINRTFVINNQGQYTGLLQGKKVLVISTSGGSYKAGTPTAAYNFQEPYLRTIFEFIGITDIKFVNAENMNLSEDVRAQSLAQTNITLENIVVDW